MKKLVIIGANDFQNQLILKAKSLGYETHVFAWEDGAVGKDNADYFYPISIIEKDKILEKCKEIKPDGVCSIASDLASITVNYVAEKLGLPCNQTKYANIQTNKYAMRKALLDAGLPCPKFVLADESFDVRKLHDFSFPIIVKPTDRSGSRNIMKLESTSGVMKAVTEACQTSFEHKAIIEEYIEGNEYSMETISYKGEHHYLATTKKFTTGAPHFIETGHCQPSDLSQDVLEKAKSHIIKALSALHIENSAGHSEFKVDKDGNIRIIEIGARMGGGCIGSDLVYLSTGNDFMKMVIDISCGDSPEFADILKNQFVCIKFLMNKYDFDNLDLLKEQAKYKIYRESIFDRKPDSKVTDDSNRLGYYIFK
ncbi:ATP-grasp domain-containing protein [Ruminococcus bromii]|uniref:ATP-grasp domain-containing protein n=1 Tax=Ruminococcus bromii TaxID=40518 RepID=UPI003F806B56